MNTPVNALRLRFPDNFEERFRDDYYYKSLKSLRLSLLLGAIIYGLFGVLDALISPETRSTVWFVRYGVACPAILACLLFTYSRHFKKYMQPAVFATVATGGIGIVAMMAIVGSPINYFHNAGVVLVLMYSYTFSKLRFVYTCAASWLIVLVYEVVAVSAMHTALPAVLNDNFLFVSANLIGMFSNYHRERYMRRDFLQNQTVRELEQKRHFLEREKILRDLHDGLGGITTNVRLLAEIGMKAKNPEHISKIFSTISELSQEGLCEIKAFIQSLDGRETTWESLAAELRVRGRSFVEPHGVGFSVTTNIDGPGDPPGSLLWLNVNRIFKEAMTNVVKHSGAKHVAVDLDINRLRLLLLVRDDGSGIREERAGGRGLSSMRKRAEEISGMLTLENSSGTSVRLEIPLPVQYESVSDQGRAEGRMPGVKAEERLRKSYV